MIRVLSAVVMILVASLAIAAAQTVRYVGSAASDNAELIRTERMLDFDRCSLSSRTGSVDVYIDPDGNGFLSSPYSLDDYGATTADPVLSTQAGRTYLFVVKAMYIQVLQNGATAASAVLNCWREGTTG